MTSRRSFLSLAAAPLLLGAGRGSLIPRATTRYADPATDLQVTRLTDPSAACVLPPAANTPIARRGQFMLYASDATGRWEAYRLDLKKGDAKQLTEAAALDPSSLTLLSGESNFCFRDGARLMTASTSGTIAREVYRTPDGFEPVRGLHVTSDGLFATVIEKHSAQHRLRLIEWRTGSATTLTEVDGVIAAPVTRPKRASVLYLRGGGVYLANFDAKQNYRLRLAESEVVQADWSPDGRSIFYLNIAGAGKINTIREFVPDTNDDRVIAETTQFTAFARNSDASMFAGASGAKVSPYILLLVRAGRRELPLCEHRSSNAALSAPVFSPNSQQVYFTSDRDGKPAIYGISLDKLASETQ